MSKLKEKKQFDFQGKIILLGESTVGKTSILQKYAKDVFNPCQTLTIGVDFVAMELPTETGKEVQLKVWDTSGQERFRSIAESFYKGSHGVILVFDLNNVDTFHKIEFWVNSIQENSDKCNIVKIIVGNKTDLDQLVDEEDIKYLCDQYNLKYFRTSAKSGEGLDCVFNYMANKTYEIFGQEYAQKIKQQKEEQMQRQKSTPQSLSNGKEQTKNKNKSCC